VHPDPPDGDGPPPRLGVGVCALNEAHALPRLLSRLLQVRDPADRADLVVVADAGSTDGTPDLARAAGAEVVEPGRGRGVQLAAAADALLAAGAEHLLFLHADCVPRTGSVAVVRAALGDGRAEAAALRQTIEGTRRAYRWIERAANGRARRGMVYGDSGLAVTSGAYRAAGGYPPWPLFEDVALSKRLRRAGVRVQLLEDATLALSPRRWEREGILRCTVRNWILRALHECGVPPERLARRYRPHAP